MIKILSGVPSKMFKAWPAEIASSKDERLDCDPARVDIARHIAAANPAAIQSLLAYVDRLEAQRDRLLIALSALHDTACKCDGWESFPSTALDAASAAITEAESQT